VLHAGRTPRSAAGLQVNSKAQKLNPDIAFTDVLCINLIAHFTSAINIIFQ
jgi:hypothetical protein